MDATKRQMNEKLLASKKILHQQHDQQRFQRQQRETQRLEQLRQQEQAALMAQQELAKNGAKIDISKQLSKTKMCMHFLKGKCRYGSECSYAHNEIELRHRPNLRKTRLCKNYDMGTCENPGCMYAHGNEELRGTDGVWKTVMCAKWLNGTCRAGSRCRFAHGQHELQEPDEEEYDEYEDERTRDRMSTNSTVDMSGNYQNHRDSNGQPMLPTNFYAGIPMSPALSAAMSPMNFGLPGLPFGVGPLHNGPPGPTHGPPSGGINTQHQQQPQHHQQQHHHQQQQQQQQQQQHPESLAVMANLVQMISDLEATDSKPPSPTDSMLPPPLPPSKWGKGKPSVDMSQESQSSNIQTLKPSNKQFLKATPERKGRPNRPLSPLSPTTLNCLPSALFSPGGLEPPLYPLVTDGW